MKSPGFPFDPEPHTKIPTPESVARLMTIAFEAGKDYGNASGFFVGVVVGIFVAALFFGFVR